MPSASSGTTKRHCCETIHLEQIHIDTFSAQTSGKGKRTTQGKRSSLHGSFSFFCIFPVCAQTCLLNEQNGVPASPAAKVTHFRKGHLSSPAVHSKRALSLLLMPLVAANMRAHPFIVFFPMCVCPRWFSFSAVSSAASRYRLHAPVFTRPAFVYVVLNRP